MEKLNLQSNIALDIDNKEYIVSIGTKELIGPLKTQVQSLFAKYGSDSIENWLKIKSDGNLLTDLALLKIRTAIYSFRSDLFHLKLINKDVSDPLLCRCLSIRVSKIKELYHEHKGDRKKLLVDSQVSGICGECRGDFDLLFGSFEDEKGYINGIDSKVWIKKVDRLIGEFFYVCPPEYSAMKFTVISMDAFNLKIRCDRGDSKVNRKDITSTLSNFFKSEMKLEVKLSVVL
jgi:hypothetical protein